MKNEYSVNACYSLRYYVMFLLFCYLNFRSVIYSLFCSLIIKLLQYRTWNFCCNLYVFYDRTMQRLIVTEGKYFSDCGDVWQRSSATELICRLSRTHSQWRHTPGCFLILMTSSTGALTPQINLKTVTPLQQSRALLQAGRGISSSRHADVCWGYFFEFVVRLLRVLHTVRLS